MSARKYLVTGGASGKLQEVYERVVQVCQKNGNFDAWFCLGNGKVDPADLDFLKNILSGAIRSITFQICLVFFDTSEVSLVENVQTCKNTQVLLLKDDLKVGIMSGNAIQDFEAALLGCKSTLPANELDIFFSSITPSAITNGASIETKEVNSLLTKLYPRYHFTTGQESYFEKPPYENLTADGEIIWVTRFISLANALTPDAKWIYAVSFEPAAKASDDILRKRPVDTIKSPYIAKHDDDSSSLPNYFFSEVSGMKRSAEIPTTSTSKKPRPGYMCNKCHSTEHYFRDCPHKDSALISRPSYICHICHEPGHLIQNCPKKNTQTPLNSKAAPAACWFCLSNPALRKHLIIDIWDEWYVTLAKGGLLAEHLLLIPIEHLPSNISLAGDLLKEFKDRLNLLRIAMEQRSKALVYFAVQHNPTHHFHYQLIGIPKSKESEFENWSLAFAQDKGYPLEEVTDPEASSATAPIFTIGLAGGKTWQHSKDGNAYFPVTFGRQMLAEFLGLYERIDWRLSPLTEEEESVIVKEWKQCL